MIFTIPNAPLQVTMSEDIVWTVREILLGQLPKDLVVTQKTIWMYQVSEMRWSEICLRSDLSDLLLSSYEDLVAAGHIQCVDPSGKIDVKVTKTLPKIATKVVTSIECTMTARLLTPLDETETIATKLAETEWEGWANGVDTRFCKLTRKYIVEPASPDHFIHYRHKWDWNTPVDNTDGMAPMLSGELNRLFAGSPDEQTLVWTMIGATLMRYKIPRVMWIRGEPGIGKSVMIRVAELLVGRSKSSPWEVEDEDQFGPINLIGRNLISVHETDSAKRLENQRTLKKMWEGDAMCCNVKGRDRVIASITANWMIAANFDPHVGAKGSSTLARILRLECLTNTPIRGTKNDDPHFAQKLVENEGQQIVDKAVSTFVSKIHMWNELTARFAKELDDTRESESSFLEFANATYEWTGNPSDEVKVDCTKDSWRKWMQNASGSDRTMMVTDAKVMKTWKEEVNKGSIVRVNRNGERYYVIQGIKEKEANPFTIQPVQKKNVVPFPGVRETLPEEMEELKDWV